MFKRFDQIAIEIPEVERPDPNAAAAVQELMGGKFGEMSTLILIPILQFPQQKKAKTFLRSCY